MVKFSKAAMIAGLVSLAFCVGTFADLAVSIDVQPSSELILEYANAEAISNDTNIALVAPEVGYFVDVSLVKASSLPVRDFDLYRSYHVPWPRSH